MNNNLFFRQLPGSEEVPGFPGKPGGPGCPKNLGTRSVYLSI